MELKEVKEFTLVMSEKEWLELWRYFYDKNHHNFKDFSIYEKKMYDRLEDLRLKKVSKRN